MKKTAILTYICITSSLSIYISCAEYKEYHVRDIEDHFITDYRQIPASSFLEESYGICSHITRPHIDYPYIDKILDITEEIGCSWIRSDLDWYSISNNLSDMHFAFLDSVFLQLKKHENIHLLPIVTNNNYHLSLDDYPEILHYRDEWEKYVSNIVERYSNQCHYWEGLNEWDYYFFKDIFDYSYGVNIQRYIYNTVKEFNENNNVLVGSTMAFESYDKLCEYGIQPYHDVANLHIYAKNAPEQNYFLKMTKIGEIYKKYKCTKPFWVTETGWTTALDYKSEEEQAYLIPRAFIVGFALGIDKIFLYNLRSRETSPSDYETNFGLVHPDLTPKPSYHSFKNLIKILPNGSTRPKMYTDGKMYLCSWIHPTWGKIYAIWMEEGTRKIKLNIEGTPHYFNYDDIERELFIPNSDEITISEKIVYITGASALLPNHLFDLYE